MNALLPDGSPLVIEALLATGRPAHLVVRKGVVEDISTIDPPVSAPRLRVRGGTVLPGLWDHHRHLRARAARRNSVDVSSAVDRDDFARRLAAALEPSRGNDAPRNRTPPRWLRVTGYDQERCGALNAADLDALAPTTRPIRIQHRSGHQWILNTAGTQALRSAGVMEVPSDGILWDRDDMLRAIPAKGVGREELDLEVQDLLRAGCVGVTDLTMTSTVEELDELAATLSGRCGFEAFGAPGGATGRWGVKIVLQEHRLPHPDELEDRIRDARPRRVAIHSVTAESLVLALAALERVGQDGDRLEHAFVTPSSVPAQFSATLAARGVTRPHVCVNPGFLRTHGDRFAQYGTEADVLDYQRLHRWSRAGFILLGGTDAPFSSANPWEAMAAAVDRRAASGRRLGVEEALSAEEAFALFGRRGLSPTGATLADLEPRVGDTADLCLVDGPWASLRGRLETAHVLATIRAGDVTWTDSHPSLEVNTR